MRLINLLKIVMLTIVLVTTVGDRQELSLTDARDGTSYELVQIGEQTWIKENIRFMPENAERMALREEGDWETFGTYYSWHLAQTACPEGFHLPTLEEWQERIGTYEGSLNTRAGKLVHVSAKDSSLVYGGMVNNGQLRAKERMGLFWTATDSASTFGVEGGELKPAYLAIHVYNDYAIQDSVNIEPTWSNSAERLFSCKCVKD